MDDWASRSEEKVSSDPPGQQDRRGRRGNLVVGSSESGTKERVLLSMMFRGAISHRVKRFLPGPRDFVVKRFM